MADAGIVFFEAGEWEEQALGAGVLKSYRPRVYRERLNEDTAELASDAEVVSVFIYSEVDKEVLNRLPALRMVSTRSTGYDHIDTEECRRRGILVSNVPYYGENTVAEHAFGLILSLSRRIYKAYLRTSRMDFSLEGLRGFDLKDRTIGVVGAGRIGLHVVRIARGFGMNVLVYDVRRESLLAEVLGFRYVSLEELLSQSDVISLHAPLNDSTYHMINKENIALIKRGALIINTARGGLIDTEALLSALDDGRIAGAGLDVFEGEEAMTEDTGRLALQLPGEKLKELVLGYAVLQRDNVVTTPHMAFYSEEALHRIVSTTEENILGFLESKPANLV